MRRATAALWVLALVVVGLQTAALDTQYFQPWLDGDVLYPQRFAEDVLDGSRPLSGWTLSTAPYLFPDFSGTALICWLRPGQPAMPIYAIAYFLALALVSGWALRRSGWTGWGGWLAGALLVNVLLAWRGVADHARVLWWLGSPGFHGGAILLGLTQFSLWAGPADTPPPWRRAVLATGIMLLGVISETLFVTQFLLPLGAALAVSSGRNWMRSPRLRRFGLCVACAFAGYGVWRTFLALAGWWNFARVFRYAPTPSAIAETAARFGRDLVGGIARDAGGFVALSAISVALALWLAWRGRKESLEEPAGRRQAMWFSAACLGSTIVLPIVSVYWQNPQHGRHILPFAVIPLWWLAAMLPSLREKFRSVSLALAGAAVIALGVIAVGGIRAEAFRWPYPARVQALDEFLRHEGLTHGLADFWNANLINRISATGLRLNQLRPDGHVKFWNNNAFQHYDVEAGSGALRAPRYRFILTESLDPAALTARFGPPLRREEVGGYAIWIYDDEAAARLSALVDGDVRAYLGQRPGTERIVVAP